MRTSFILLSLACCSLIGCSHQDKVAPRDSVTNFPTKALIVPPEPADPAPTMKAIEAAKTDVSGAQSNVQTVLSAAKTSELAPVKAAVQPLTAADGQLTSATKNMNEALARNSELA